MARQALGKLEPAKPMAKSAGAGSSAKSVKPLDAFNPEIARQLDLLVKAHLFAEENFDAKITKHADWILIKLLLENDNRGRATVVKHMIEASKCSAGTVRQMFNSFQRHGYIIIEQKIGRSELYRPTLKLKKFVGKWSQAISTD